MLTTIADGRSSETASVLENRLSTTAVTEDEGKLAAVSGDAYNLNTGIITLTNAVKTAVFYVKNTGDIDLIIDVAFFISGNSTGGAGSAFIEVIRNPTTGTIISGATAISMNANRNFGSNNTLTADVYRGATGSTFTSGTDALGSITNVPSTIPVEAGAIVLKKGSSLGVNYTAPVGNTSLPIQIAVSIYEKQI